MDSPPGCLRRSPGISYWGSTKGDLTTPSRIDQKYGPNLNCLVVEFQPIWKILYSQIGVIFPRVRGENNKYFELPPLCYLVKGLFHGFSHNNALFFGVYVRHNLRDDSWKKSGQKGPLVKYLDHADHWHPRKHWNHTPRHQVRSPPKYPRLGSNSYPLFSPARLSRSFFRTSQGWIWYVVPWRVIW